MMKKRIAGLVVFVLAVMLAPAALPQMESTPIVYTYVSQSKSRGRVGRHTRKAPRSRSFRWWRSR